MLLMLNPVKSGDLQKGFIVLFVQKNTFGGKTARFSFTILFFAKLWHENTKKNN